MRHILLSFILLVSALASTAAKQEKSTIEADAVYNKAVELYNSRDYQGALPLFDKALSMREAIRGRDLTYARQLDNMARCRYATGDYRGAIETQMEVCNLIGSIVGNANLEYASGLSDLALYCHLAGDDAGAIKYGNMSRQLRHTILSQEIPNYAMLLGNLAAYNANTGDYTSAVTVAEEALDTRRRYFGPTHALTLKTIGEIADYQLRAGNKDEAIRRATEGVSAILADSVVTREAADAHSRLAHYLAEAGDISGAIDHEREAMRINERLNGGRDDSCAPTLSRLARLYERNGDRAEAIRCETEALELYDPTSDNALNSLAILAGYHSSTGNYAAAIRYAADARERYVKAGKTDTQAYAVLLNDLALYNSATGNYAEHARLATESIELSQRLGTVDAPSYAQALMSLATSRFLSGDTAGALETAETAVSKCNEVFGRQSPQYATAMSNLAIIRYNTGDIAGAETLITDALRVHEERDNTDSPDYATLLNNLGAFRYYAGETDKALDINTRVLDIRRRSLGTAHPDYAFSLANAANIYHTLADTDRLIPAALEVSRLKMRLVRSAFTTLTTDERNRFWSRHDSWFTDDIQQYAAEYRADSLAANAYDGALFYKGLLLNTETELENIIRSGNDPEAVGLYASMRDNMVRLNRLYEMPIRQRDESTDSLEKVIGSQERRLVAMSKAYGDYTRSLSADHHDVSSHLADNEAAIDFTCYHVSDTADTRRYVALVTRHDDHPVAIPLFDDNTLNNINDNELYTRPTLSRMLWEPLMPHLEGVTRIYFSPAGRLHNIAIEHLPSPTGNGLMSDDRTLVRLSSTRLLALDRQPTAPIDGVVYGGMRFDAGAAGVSVKADYLPATLTEAQSVTDILSSMNTKATLHTGEDATETSFKSLSGRQVNLAHIATHGFYLRKDELASHRRMRFLQLNNDRADDRPLTRSGLLFAGADNALSGHTAKNGDDGVLTAKEISLLDLSAMRLVVLSACQTGLGEITGEGVFGLQRGFKKAGVKSLMMSLWKVDDNATRLLMTRFYEGLSQGKPTHGALTDAQQYVRQYTEGGSQTYSDPQYWSAFILLDALD
ncbi:MAG: CHAT domain-containing protein [Pseudoflavonifractor sp.]|nr:CHAT domain-containing protein [Pseudoflavonifractor sp.]